MELLSSTPIHLERQHVDKPKNARGADMKDQGVLLNGEEDLDTIWTFEKCLSKPRLLTRDRRAAC